MKIYKILQKIINPKKCQWTHDAIVCPRCGSIAFTRPESPLWMTSGHCFKCGKYLTWDREEDAYSKKKTKSGFTITFPYNTGTFVIINKENIDCNRPESLLGNVGTISCYNCVDEKDTDDNFLVVVSGYKDAWCGEYLLSDIRLATESEIADYKKLKGIDE